MFKFFKKVAKLLYIETTTHIQDQIQQQKLKQAAFGIGPQLLPSHQLQAEFEMNRFRYIKYYYLQSPSWKRKKSQILHRDGYRCVVCNSSESLEGHHIAMYDAIPNEPLESIVTLCRECHQKEHDLHGYPQTYKDYQNWNVPAPQSRTLLKSEFTYTPSH